MKGERMRHSDKEIKEAATRFERLVEEIELNPGAFKLEHLGDLQAVASAAAAVHSAQARLVEAVEISRARGRSWNELAVALNVSRQAARQRYGNTSNVPKQPEVDRRTATSRARRVGARAVKVGGTKKPAVRNAATKRGRKTA